SVAGMPATAVEPTAEQIEFFEARVRPIFVEHCYECHSTTADDVEANLLLDSRWGWETGGDSGPAIVPGKLDESLIIEAVRYEDDIVSAMPPRSKLAAKDIRTLEKWVGMGAPDPREMPTETGKIEKFDLNKRRLEHWSWRPISNPRPPQVSDETWPNNDIDRFVLSKIESAGLTPASDADKRTWLRRVHFDLIGLPPSPSEIATFLADEQDNAQEHVVDALLRSPHFGEKWARHWMDLVRYAETYGHEFDYPIRGASQYRDYLIRAFNADVPFDEFTREHIAGDLIPDPRRHPDQGWNESVIGTGFWYFHEATHAPTDVLGNEADIVDNQIDVFGKAFLGLTVACARCHDHKFDAISTADYYALSAYLQSSCRQEYPLDTGMRRETATKQIDALRLSGKKLLQSTDLAVAPPADYYRVASEVIALARPANANPSFVHEIASTEGLDGERLQKWVESHDKLKWHRSASNEIPNDQVAWDFNGDRLPTGWSTSGTAFHAIGDELSLTVDGDIASPNTIDSSVAGVQQVGILRSPTFEISTDHIHIRMRASADVMVRLIIDNYQMAEFNALLFNGTFLNKQATDTNGQWAWKTLARDLRKYVGHRAYLEFVDPGNGTIAIDRIVLSNEAAPRSQAPKRKFTPTEFREFWDASVSDLHTGRHPPFFSPLIQAGLLSIEDLNAEASACLLKAQKLAEGLPPPRTVVAMAQGTPEDAHVYIRGSHSNQGESVPARFLEALGGEPSSRLELAHRVASPDNPLTSRVIVNRVWHHLFGRGIVPTVDDFGPQGRPPSHPNLLDWLAQDFISHGWSLKHLIKEIVLSRSYRQSSIANESLSRELIESADPTNKLLHRMPVRRLQSEAIRDAILSASGRLDPKLFGTSVATHRTPYMSGRGARASGPLDGDGRRSIYLSIYRNFLNPFMLTFDMPSPFGPQGRRSQSNVPAQALTLMNDPFVIEQSKVMAKEILQDSGTTTDRIATLVERTHGQEPNAEQVRQLNTFLDRQADLYGSLDERAWADLGHALFNMKAFYFLR
ncbi:MAG: PSD1 and planctomycete cytochrome C domain-containing protein, partial [Rubripirellula sp.]